MRHTPAFALIFLAFGCLGADVQLDEKLDTPQVHAFVTTLPPHAGIKVAAQPANRVLIYMDDGSVEWQENKGAGQTLQVRRGDVRWRPASAAYVIRNAGDRPVRVLEIVLKEKPAGPAPVSKIDPSGVDPDHYHVELENDQVRVLRIHYGPHENSPQHEHILNRVVLFLNEQGGGKLDEVHMSGAVTHVEKNDRDQPADRIAVELK